MANRRSISIQCLVIGCALACSPQRAANVRADGSSTVFPITAAVAEEFNQTHQVGAAIGFSGTGGGFKRFCRGELDVSGASRPIKAAEAGQCASHGVEYVEIPIAYDGLAVVVHPKNTWVSSITTAELKAMWEPAAQGKSLRWSDVREGWPAHELHLHGAGADSGTYDYFTQAIIGEEHRSRTDYRSSEDDNDLVGWIAEDENALGFFGYAYYEHDKSRLKLVPIDDERSDNGAGPILPTPDTVAQGSYQPLARPLFVYVSTAALGRPEVAAFVAFYLERAATLVPQVGYIPLPPAAYTLARQRVESRRTGSLFGARGSQVGVSIQALLEKEQASEQ